MTMFFPKKRFIPAKNPNSDDCVIVKRILILSFVGLASLLSSCYVSPNGRVYPAPVTVGVGAPVVVAPGLYGEPYFVFGGIYYYQFHGRYCYYDHGHRVFVSRLPRGGHYYRHGERVVR